MSDDMHEMHSRSSRRWTSRQKLPPRNLNGSITRNVAGDTVKPYSG
jgi:hypothetical protein